jgi:hypothetical protein
MKRPDVFSTHKRQTQSYSVSEYKGKLAEESFNKEPSFYIEENLMKHCSCSQKTKRNSTESFKVCYYQSLNFSLG